MPAGVLCTAPQPLYAFFVTAAAAAQQQIESMRVVGDTIITAAI